MDMESYIYNIRTPDFYGDMKEMIEHFDALKYSDEFRKYHDMPCVHRMVLGKMKDENGGKVLLVELRSKLHAGRKKQSRRGLKG